MQFMISFFGLITAYAEASVTGSYAIASGNILAANAVASIVAPSPLSSSLYAPGDTMKIRFEYSNYEANEDTVVFFELVNDYTGVKIPIKMDSFVSSASGAGSVEFTWRVPYDLYFAGSEHQANKNNHAYINLRASNMLSKSYSTDRFGFTMFTSTDSIFTSPRTNEVVPLDVPFELKWDASLLSFYERKDATQIHGRIVTESLVNLELVGEILSSDGLTVLSTSSYRKLVNGPIANTGSVMVTFPSSSLQGTRFYLKVMSATYANVAGWSGGYFTFARGGGGNGEIKTIKSSNLRTVTDASITTPSHQAKPLAKVPVFPTKLNHNVDLLSLDTRSAIQRVAMQHVTTPSTSLLGLQQQQGRRALQSTQPASTTLSGKVGGKLTGISVIFLGKFPTPAGLSTDMFSPIGKQVALALLAALPPSAAAAVSAPLPVPAPASVATPVFSAGSSLATGTETDAPTASFVVDLGSDAPSPAPTYTPGVTGAPTIIHGTSVTGYQVTSFYADDSCSTMTQVYTQTYGNCIDHLDSNGDADYSYVIDLTPSTPGFVTSTQTFYDDGILALHAPHTCK